MSDYWLGFATPFVIAAATAVALFLVGAIIAPPRWSSITCICGDYKQIRSNHPRRPAWAWRLVEWWQHGRFNRPLHHRLRAAWRKGGISALNDARRLEVTK